MAEHIYSELTPTLDTGLTLPDVRRQWDMLAQAPYALTPMQSPPLKVVNIAPGIEQYMAMFSTQVIVSDDGLVVVDPSNNTTYAEQTIADLAKRHQGKRIVAVVVSDPYWAHFGGLRAFARLGVPVYCAENNVRQLRAFCAARHTKRPETSLKNPKFMPVRTTATIGKGPNALVLANLPGPETERMLAVYVPKQRIVFASDTIVVLKDKPYSNQTADELVRTVKGLGWDVDRVYATHNPLIEWSKLQEMLPRK